MGWFPPTAFLIIIWWNDNLTIFCNIWVTSWHVCQVRQCSEKFLEDLEKRWQSSFLLNGLCEVVRQHAENNFQVAVSYNLFSSSMILQDPVKNICNKLAVDISVHTQCANMHCQGITCTRSLDTGLTSAVGYGRIHWVFHHKVLHWGRLQPYLQILDNSEIDKQL